MTDDNLAIPQTVIRDRERAIKNKRFTTAANVISKRATLTCDCCPDPTSPVPAYTEDTDIHINEAIPTPPKDAALALALDKGKLYHELAHVQFTRFDDHRLECAKLAHDLQAFLTLSNILEDGRIERIQAETLPGAAAYIRLVTATVFRGADPAKLAPEMWLALRVRLGKYITPEAEAYWKPHEADIERAVNGRNTKAASEAALAIVNRMHPKPSESSSAYDHARASECYPKVDKIRPQVDPRPDLGDDESDDDGDDSGGGKDDPAESDDDIGDTTDSTGARSDEADGNGDGEETKGEPTTTVGKRGGNPLDQEYDLIAKEVIDDARDELDDIHEAAVTNDIDEDEPEPAKRAKPQEYANAGEQAQADALAQILRDLRADRARDHSTPNRHTGRVNSRRLPAALTGGSALLRTERYPDVSLAAAICQDRSGSMAALSKSGEFPARARELGDLAQEAARIILGGLRQAGAETVYLPFNFGRGTTVRRDVVPTEYTGSSGGWATSDALAIAAVALAKSKATHKVAFVLNDGTSDIQITAAIEQARNVGIYIVVLGIGADAKSLPYLQQQGDEAYIVNDMTELTTIMQQIVLTLATKP